jgi:multidrug efflux pump subunit AcrA (membrane-fusion protein)
LKKKFKWKKLIIVVVIIAAILVAAVMVVKNKLSQVASSQSANLVQLEEIRRQDLSDFISLTGTVSGETKTNYSSSATAEFATVNVKVGDVVKEGDVLATLDTTSIETQIAALEKSLSNASALKANQEKLNQHALDQAKSDQSTQLNQANQAISSADAAYAAAEANVNNIQNQINAVNDQINAAETEEEKESLAMQLEQLQEQKTAAVSELSSADSARTEARNNYNSVKSATDEAIYSAQNTIDASKYSSDDDSATQTQLEELREQLEDCTITCKGDGIVTSVLVAEGDVNTPNAAVITVENDQTMIMTASVTETDILKLQEGMKAIVTASALDEQEIQGEVIKVVKVYNAGTSSDDSTGTGGFSVQIKLADSELLSGMSAKAKVILTDKTNILCVPYDLVQEDESGQSYVLCAEDNGDGTYTAVRKDIETGDEVNYYIEVTGGDVQEGDYVILDYSISEGDVFQATISMETEEESDTGTVG